MNTGMSVVFLRDTYPLLSLSGCLLVFLTETESVSPLPTMPSGLEEYYHSDP